MASMSASLQLAVNAAGNLQVFDRIRGELRDLNETSARTTQRLEQLNSASRMLLGAFGVGSLVDVTRSITNLADEYQNLQGRLKLVTSSQAEYEQVQKRLIQLADQNRQGLSETTKLYTGIAPSLKQMGKSQDDILKIVDTTSKALVVGGATAEGSKAALLQLTQALASGVLRGDEFNSIMENGTGIAKALADGLGLPIGKLRGLAEEGKLTAEVVSAALESQNKAITEQFNGLPVTIGQAMIKVQNALLLGVGATDEYLGASKFITEQLTDLSRNLENVAFAGTALAVLFAGRLVNSKVTAMQASRAAVSEEQRAMAVRNRAAQQEAVIAAQRARDALVDAVRQKAATAAALEAATARITAVNGALQAETVAEARRTRMALAAAERHKATTAAAVAAARAEAALAAGTAQAAAARAAMNAAQAQDAAALRSLTAARTAQANAAAAIAGQAANHLNTLRARDEEATRALTAARTAESNASTAALNGVRRAEIMAEAQRAREALTAAERHKATTAAALAAARSEAVLAAGTERAAATRAALNAAQAQDVAATRALAAARLTEAAATNASNAAQVRATFTARALASAQAAAATASRAFSSALMLVGGPTGAAVLGIIGLAMYGDKLIDLITYSGQAERAETLHKEAMDKARDAAYEYADASDTLRQRLDKQREAALEAAKASVAEAKAALESAKAKLVRDQQLASGGDSAVLSGFGSTDTREREVEFADGQLTARIKELDALEERYKLFGSSRAQIEAKIAEASKREQSNTKESGAALLAKTEIEKEAQEQAKKHAEALKSLTEDLIKQRIAIEHGEAAAKYYTDRLSGLSDAESRLAGSAKQYNDYLAERDRLQRRASELKGGLRTQYVGTLKDKGLDVPVGANFDAVQGITQQSIKAAEDYKKALEAAAKAGSASVQAHAKEIQRNAYEVVGAIERNAYDVYRSITSASQSASALIRQDTDQLQQSITKTQRAIQALISTEGSKTRVYQNNDGTIETRTGGTVSWRNNNPGNLKFEYAGSADSTVQSLRSKAKALADAQKRYADVVDLDQYGNAIFATEEAGRAAQARLLTKLHGMRTVEQMLPRYAITDYSGKANVQSYADKIHSYAGSQGIDLKGKLLGSMSANELSVLTTAMKSMEGWKEGTVSIKGEVRQIAASVQQTVSTTQAAAQATNTLANSTQLYRGTLDGARVTQAEINSLIDDHMSNEMNEILKKAREHHAELTLTAKGYRELQLINQEFYPDQVRTIMTEEQQNALVAERKKLTDDQNRIAANGNQRRLYELELEKQGWFDKGEMIELANQAMENSAKEMEQELTKQNQQLSMSAAAYRKIELGAKGYNDQQVRTITQLEKQNLLLSTQKQLDQERRSLKNNPYQVMSLELQDKGASKAEADSKAAEKQQIDFDKLKKGLKEKAEALKLTAIEQYKAELAIAGYNKEMQKEAAVLQATISLRETERSLKKERLSIKNNPYQLMSLELQDNGVSKAAADSKAAEKQQLDFDKLKKGLKEKAEALKLTTIEQYKAELGIAGYSAAMQKEAAALQSNIVLLETQKSLEQERRSIRNNPYQVMSLNLQDQGISKAAADGEAAKKRALDFEKITKELEKQQKLIGLNAQEQYRASLVEQGYVKIEVEKAAQLSYQNMLLTEQHKLRQEAAQIKAVGLRATYELELKNAGAKPQDIKGLADDRMNNEFDRITQQLRLQRQELTLSTEAYRVLQLETDKFGQAQVRYISTQEQANAKLGELKKVGADVYGKVQEALMQTVMGGKADWSGLVEYMLQQAMRLMVIEPLMKSLFGKGGSDGSWLTSLFSSFMPHAQGGAFTNSGVRFFAQGGIVSSPTAFRFAGSRLGVMGEAGPEAIVPLARTASGDLGVRQLPAPMPTIQMAIQPEFLVPPLMPAPLSGAMPAINVQVINNGQPVNAEVSQSPNKDGGIDLTLMLDQVENSMAQRMVKGGPLQNATANTFALNRSAGSYR